MHGITTHKTKLLETISRFILLFRSSCFLVIALSYKNKTHIFSGRAASFFGFLTEGECTAGRNFPDVPSAKSLHLTAIFVGEVLQT
jgi:hypothetical protein